jgi:hypothetical protein
MSREVLNVGFTHDGGGNNLKNAFDKLNTMLTEIYSFMETPTGLRYVYHDDGTNQFRTGIRSGAFVLDQAISATGFDGTEGVDWDNIKSEKL